MDAANQQVLTLARGSSGGRSSSGARSSSSRSSSSTSSNTSKSTGSGGKNTTSGTAPKATTSKAQPTRKTTTTTTAKKPSTSTTQGKQYSQRGYVVDQGYQPKFSGGYSAPAGSTVYYRDNSFVDFLPWIYLFSQDGRDGQKEAIVVQPDGKEVKVKEEGVDGMYIFNWIFAVVLIVGVVAGAIWGVNKLISRRNGY